MIDVQNSKLVVAMRAKDPELLRQVMHIPTYEVANRWRERYPEDFPKGGMTSLEDGEAIKPKNLNRT